MQVKLDDSTNINVEKTDDSDVFIMSVENRVKMYFSRAELKYVYALIDSALKEDEVMSREALQKSLMESVVKNKSELQLTLRNMKIEDIAYTIWYIGEQDVTDVVMSNISKRSAEDVTTYVKEGIERRMRKERSEGNADIEKVMKDHGRNAASALLKKVLSS